MSNITLPREVVEQAVAALDCAMNGLQWYRDANPGQKDGSDDEADELIGSAFDALRAALTSGVPEAQPLPSEGAIHPLAAAAAAEPLQLLIDEVGRMRRALDAIYGHNEAARAAVVQHYGLHHKDISLLVSVLRAAGVIGTLKENRNG